ncbi:MAG: putative GNAT family N-acyltransferase [Candidatus Azotimanducaceae bacterium]|jgi:predicted GNAT family N-acyltransferase
MPTYLFKEVAGLQQAAQLAALARQTFRQAYADEMHPQHMDEHLERELCDEAFRTMLSTDRVLVATCEGQGLSHTLLEMALALEKLAQAPRVMRLVWETNHSAQRLYKSYGFEKIGERAEFDYQGNRTGADFIMVKLNPENQ